MSRRHKELEEADNYEPQQAESQEDGSPRVKRSLFDACFSIKNFTITKRDGSKGQFLMSKIIEAINGAFSRNEVEVDDKWMKIPLTAFKGYSDCNMNRIVSQVIAQGKEEKKESKRGAHPIKRLFKKIADCKVMEFFHKTWDAAKEKCAELIENVTQFCTCFLHGSHKAFAPDEDPYRKVSHFYDMVKAEVWDFPTRKTLSNYNNWFVNWTPVVINETPKEKEERHRHSLWKQLIEWIYCYLLKIAPKYAFQTQRG